MIRGAIVLALIAGAATAQNIPASSVEFQRRQFEPQPTPGSEPARPVEAVSAPAAADQGEASFVLRGVTLQDATALPESALADIWTPLIGAPVTLATLNDIAAGIAARYRAAGFVLSQAVVPAQTIVDGMVVIQVIEGFIDAVETVGGDAAGQAAAQRFMAPVTADRPLRLETLERGVLLTREAVGSRFETALRPSEGAFGAATLSALVPDRPQVDAFLAADNYSSRLYGAFTLSGGATAYNALGLSDQIEFLAAGAPNDNYFAFAQGRFSAPPAFLDGTVFDGGRLELLASYSRGEPDLERVGATLFESEQEDFEATVAFEVPFVRTRAESLFGRVGLTWRDSSTSSLFDGAKIDEFTDEILVGEASVTWDLADRFNGVTLLSGGVRQGIHGDSDATGPGSPDENFTSVLLSAVRLQQLPIEGWSLYAKAVTQVTDDDLTSSERFGLGGEALGRGFAPGNTVGDSGYGFRVELRRFVGGGELASVGMDAVLAGAELFGFADYGQARDSSAARDGRQWETLGSAGFGARLDLTEDLTLTSQVAFQTAGRPNDNRNDDREARFLVSLIKRF